MARDLDIYLAGEWSPGTGDEYREIASPGSGEHIANVPLASRVRAGTVVINDSTDFWETLQPFGGAAGTASGWGRGTIDDFTDLQTMGIDIGRVK